MAFLETPRFPEDISYGSVGGPEFKTDVIVIRSGDEFRNQNWADARAVYDVSHGLQSQQELDELIEFFRAVRGRLHGFRFKDWSDYGVTLAMSDGDGPRGITVNVTTGTVYQMQKRYVSGALTYDRKIVKVVSANNVTSQTAAVYAATGGLMNVSSYTMNINSGTITFVTSRGAPSWVGEFDVPCRFDTDRMPIRLEAPGAFTWGDIPVVELKR
jgi:uncharacterized protein (TIGR02217 family)